MSRFQPGRIVGKANASPVTAPQGAYSLQGPKRRVIEPDPDMFTLIFAITVTRRRNSSEFSELNARPVA